jgi:SNF2 family DNA or RNA helicase
MPGYLGPHESFRRHYELPIAQGGFDGEEAQVRLRRKLNPFLLRRLKADVAKELPPKIERVASCTLTADQQQVYRTLVEQSQRTLADLVRERGFKRCTIEVLKTLLQLRQVCCHIDLLHLQNVQSTQPSAKLDLFLELVDEAIDGGHRILVFSQFVSMLTILRRELDSRHIRYCYLDGATKERQKIVHEFNSDRAIPLFLISLKAGGTGLNLTGADMVIHFDPWWNPAVENQATDRAYRIGQRRTVYSIKLITKGTIEEKVLALQKKKKSIIDATLATDEGILESLTWEDVEDLLRL